MRDSARVARVRACAEPLAYAAASGVRSRRPSLSAAMPVPLFDTATPLAPLRAEIDAAIAPRHRQRQVHPRAGGAARSSRSSPRTAAPGTRSASPTAPTRSRSRCARWASGPATRSSCRRSRSTRAPRRSRRPARGRSSATSIPRRSASRAETVQAAITPRTKAVIAVHLFGNVAPSPTIEALGVPVLEDAAQAAGSALARRPSRRAGQHRDVQLLPVEEPRRVRRRRRDHDADDDALADRVRMLRFHGSLGQGHLRARGLQLAPRRAAGRDPARAAPAPRRLGGRAPRRRAATTRRPGSGELVDLPVAGRRRAAGLAPLRGPQRARGRARRGARGGRPRAQGVLPHAGARAAGDARVRGRRRASRRPPRSRGRTSRSR